MPFFKRPKLESRLKRSIRYNGEVRRGQRWHLNRGDLDYWTVRSVTPRGTVTLIGPGAEQKTCYRHQYELKLYGEPWVAVDTIS